MFCIAAFIILILLSIFSAKYRKMLGKSWACVARRITFRPCDTNFKEEVKSKLLSKVALKKPNMVKAADIGLEVGAVLILLITAWSLYVVVKSGLNLYVYGTCNPSNSASCSLGAEACSIETVKPSFVDSVTSFKVHVWLGNEFKDLGKTVGNIPTRLQKWDAKVYLPQNATYQKPFDQAKQTALEVIDPGCTFCRQLYINQKQAGFADRFNLSYIAYPIPSAKEQSGYKFENSLLITKYLEAMRIRPLKNAQTPADWQIIDRIFTWQDDEKVGFQIRFNAFYNQKDAESKLLQWAKEIGYSDEDIAALKESAASSLVSDIIAANRKTVEDRIKTVKIPTSIFDGKRHDGVLSVQDLQR